jgi:hypothetical protein
LHPSHIVRAASFLVVTLYLSLPLPCPPNLIPTHTLTTGSRTHDHERHQVSDIRKDATIDAVILCLISVPTHASTLVQ